MDEHLQPSSQGSAPNAADPASGPSPSPAHDATNKQWNSGVGTSTTLKVLFSDVGRLHSRPHGPRALIVGAGISGLTAAAGLHKAGWRVTVQEQAEDSIDSAAQMGIALSAAAVASLRAVGVDVGVLASGEPIRKRRVMLSSGRLVRETSAAAEELEHGVPGVMLTRADLLAALRTSIERDQIHRGYTFRSFEEEALGVAAHLVGPAQEEAIVRADAIIGADGIRSGVRTAALKSGSLDAMRWQAIYGIAEAPISMYPSGTLTRVWGHGTRMGIYRIPPRRREIASPHRVAWWIAREVWSDEAPMQDAAALRQQALAMTDGWWHTARDLIMSTTTESFRAASALSDVHAAQRASCTGRVALLGDAAHPLWPLVDDGAAMAIRDGMSITAMLAETSASDVPKALRAFEARRDVVVSGAIRRARLLTPLKSTLLSSLREGLVRVMPGSMIAGSLEAHG